MPVDKQVLLRYQVLNRCFRNRYRDYTIDDLVDECNKALRRIDKPDVFKHISENTRNKNWGTGAIDNISKQLRQELPGLRGFGASNLKNMRLFYEAWYMIEPNSPITIGELNEDLYHHQDKMPNNFLATIPDYKQAYRAIRMFKDEYLLDYINVEELGMHDEDVDERVIEGNNGVDEKLSALLRQISWTNNLEKTILNNEKTMETVRIKFGSCDSQIYRN